MELGTLTIPLKLGDVVRRLTPHKNDIIRLANMASNEGKAINMASDEEAMSTSMNGKGENNMMATVGSEGNSRWWTPTILVGIVCIIGALAWGSTMTALYVQERNNGGDDDKNTYVCPVECLCNIEDWANAFNSTVKDQESSVLGVPSCVSENFMGLVVSLGANAPLPTMIKSTGRGRRVAFVAGPTLLEKALVFGQFNVLDLLVNIGFGEMPSTKGDHYILAFERPLTGVYQGYWENLDEILIPMYGKALPDISAALEDLAEETFEEASGCAAPYPSNRAHLEDGAFQNCSDCFQEAVDRFEAVKCNGSDANSPVYTPEAGCPAEEAFLSDEAPLTACELRAYLFRTQGFFPEYTGYGYTANTVSLVLFSCYCLFST